MQETDYVAALVGGLGDAETVGCVICEHAGWRENRGWWRTECRERNMGESGLMRQAGGFDCTFTAPDVAGAASIIHVGTECGDVRLVGRQVADEAWRFRRLSAVDPTLPGSSEPVWVDTWEAAIDLMDRYPWAELFPLAVHPEFRGEVLFEVTRRLLVQPSPGTDHLLDRWLRVCEGV